MRDSEIVVASHEAARTSNIEHPTPNIESQRESSLTSLRSSMFDVGCSMLSIRFWDFKLSLLSEAVQFFQSLTWHLEAVSFRTAHFDDVPFGAGTGFAEVKYFFVKVALESFVLVFFDVNRPGSSWELREHGDRIVVVTEGFYELPLHVFFGFCLAVESV